MSTTISGSDNFNSSTIPCDVVLQAGGGGGGGGESNPGGDGGGGGGAGGQRVCEFTAVKGKSYPVVVGTGGLGSTGNNIGSNGNNTTFGGLTAFGGGAGSGGGTEEVYAGDGGCGGGSCNRFGNPAYGGSCVPGQGCSGGDSWNTGPWSGNATSYRNGSGGGGVSKPGFTRNSSNTGGTGGDGSTTWAGTMGGGGGGGASSGNGIGTGGKGGGGNGANSSTAATAGTANTGGGGGGGNGHNTSAIYWAGANGGSGKFSLRHPDTYPVGIVSGSATITQSGGYYIYTFTGNGTISF